jgi:hypothetical protein
MIGVVSHATVLRTWSVVVDGKHIEAMAEDQFVGKNRTRAIMVGQVVRLRPPKEGSIFRCPFITEILGGGHRKPSATTATQQGFETMTFSNAIATTLANYPIGNATDAEFRGLLTLAYKLAVSLGTSGTGTPAKLTLDFLAAQLDDTLLVEKCRTELNYLVERECR